VAGRVLGRAGLARRATLRDAENLVYKDSEPDPTSGDNLAYIGKLGAEPAFVRYEVLTEIRKQRDRFMKHPTPQTSDTGRVFRDPEKAFEIWVEKLPADVLQRWLGTIWGQGEKGILHDIDFASNTARALRVYQLASHGPQRMPEGFGSRLPTAQGRLYSTVREQRAEIFEALGVSPDKLASYAGVTIEYVDLAEARAKYLEADVGDENAQWLEVGPHRTPLVYVSTVVAPRSSIARFRAKGVLYDEHFSGVTAKELAALQRSFDALGRARASRDVPGTKIGKEPRGLGQANAMDGWNALGAAAFANAFRNTSYDLNQNWEWLHVRAASAGGATNGENLVAGRFGANSLMITYERLIKEWAAVDRENVWFHFVPVNPRPGFADKIEFWVLARGHRILGDIEPAMRLISIDVTKGKVVDALSDQIIKRHVDWEAGVRAPAAAAGDPMDESK
jgi:hypothetical protein